MGNTLGDGKKQGVRKMIGGTYSTIATGKRFLGDF